MNERIKQVRKALKLSQEAFAKPLGVGRGAITNIEYGKLEPRPAFVDLICRTYNINEEWMKTGNGPMFLDRTREQELTDFMSDMITTDNEFKQRLILYLSRMSEEQWKMAIDMAKFIVTQDLE